MCACFAGFVIVTTVGYNISSKLHFSDVGRIDSLPVLMLRPRAWNMPENNMLVNSIDMFIHSTCTHELTCASTCIHVTVHVCTIVHRYMCLLGTLLVTFASVRVLTRLCFRLMVKRCQDRCLISVCWCITTQKCWLNFIVDRSFIYPRYRRLLGTGKCLCTCIQSCYCRHD